MMCHQQDKKEKDVDGLGKRRKTSQSEDVSNSDNKLVSDFERVVIFLNSLSDQNRLMNPSRLRATGKPI